MSSLVAERGAIHVHVGATMLMEGKAPQLDELLEHVDGRLHLVPRFRQRVTPHRFNSRTRNGPMTPTSTCGGTSGKPRCRGPGR